MKKTSLLALLSIALLPGTAFAKKLDDARQATQAGQVALVDANGTMIGDVQTNVRADFARVYFVVNEKHYYAQLEDEWFYGYYLYYDAIGCTGNAYVGKPYVMSNIVIRNNIITLEALRDGIFYTTDSDVPQSVTLASVWEELDGKANCVNFTAPPPINVYPAIPIVDTNVYAKPYQLKMILAK
jgi:hypothetical protein